MNHKRKTLTQRQYNKLKNAARPDCAGCATLLRAIEPYVQLKAGRPGLGEGGRPLTAAEAKRRYREKKKLDEHNK